MKMTFELGKAPAMTEDQIARLDALEKMPDGKIDYTEIPKMTEDDFQNMVLNPWYKPKKVQVTARLDSDIVAWLRRSGKGYQTRLNAILKRVMLEDIKTHRAVY